ncbi:aminotransferase class I/II-fold pyridoxal phosphate-dependent enzyme [Calothrix sp. UHCC 0171]|uniref:aminotransferase class I/II-fold pyridoxal phosphate-dependent enzyme n=1 Tax=Calothrix sp. UHCC 0171 TaxID=3110245 RepID=UPI002B215BC9|nr:aminotransferase class I/II-fold pyridoxal phosphate-dependent enzyme [Calothrix sp. UHCC 0171]MEA5570452.1 aminotransferase class I/II-fold pyridoxal phosphate-dependent enzyme [Calothrix sp. UHCC 0171]
MKIQVSTPIMSYMKLLESQGITDIEELSNKLYEHYQQQVNLGLYSNGRYTESGSGVKATVISTHGDKNEECILWCMNHYLGLNRNQNVIDKVCQAVQKYGTGSGTSALSGGMSTLHKQVEQKLQKLIGKESVLLFPTGFTTNIGCLSALPGKKDLLIFDRECHASIIDGVKLSGRKWVTFKHNNVADLEQKLNKYKNEYENIFVIVESAYSMSGDLAPLLEIVQLKQKYKFLIYVDEAHTFGIYGKNGAGYCSHLGIVEEVDFIAATLSKATASIGGFVAIKSKYIPLLHWRASTYTFQACLTPADAAAILASLEEIEANPQLIESLHENNHYMRNRLQDLGFDLGTSVSPIIPIFIPDTDTLLAFNKELYARGIFSVSIFYPVVKPHEGRIRFILSAVHTKEQIDITVNALHELGLKYSLISRQLITAA